LKRTLCVIIIECNVTISVLETVSCIYRKGTYSEFNEIEQLLDKL